jgi:hypothetical protein
MLSELKVFLKIKYLPSLVMVSNSLEVITDTGRKEIYDRGINAVINWDGIWKTLIFSSRKAVSNNKI